MGILKDLQKYVKAHHLIALVGLLVLVIAITQYSSVKQTDTSAMQNNHRVENKEVNNMNVMPANPIGENEMPSNVNGMDSNVHGLPPTCANREVVDPAELLPKDSNSQWSELNPSGDGDLKNVNLLKSGYHAGIDTVGGSLRNANLQVRSEPPNPQVKVSPWQNTTIEPDLMRVPLEIGCGPQ